MSREEEKALAKKRTEADEKLWIETEKKLATRFDPEDLRTSGLLAGRKRRWNASLTRLSEAALHGLRDAQLLDTLGEAAYRSKTPEALLPYLSEYRDPLIATHMARALMDLGDLAGVEEYLKLAKDSNLKTAIQAMMGFKDSIEQASASMLAPIDAALRGENPSFLKLDYPAFWQALAPIGDVVGRMDVVNLAEERSKALDFQNKSTHYNQALRLLAAGEFRAGWQLYDWRLYPEVGSDGGSTFAEAPMWQGESLSDKTLLVALEYGFGDQIFSLRFLREAIAKLSDSKIEIAASRPLFDLVGASFPDQVIHQIDEVKTAEYWRDRQPIHFWCYAFSLPARLEMWSPVQTKGYLTAPTNLVNAVSDKIRDELGGRELPVFGLTWHGDVATHAMRTRAYSIEEFVEQTNVLAGPAVIVNLQKDATAEELRYLQERVDKTGGALIDAAPMLIDFSQTAAWIKGLDRLYSCDTSVAHLGGALKAPTTVLVRNRMIWHWIKRPGQEQSLWYDSATIQYALTPKLSYMFDFRMS